MVKHLRKKIVFIISILVFSIYLLKPKAQEQQFLAVKSDIKLVLMIVVDQMPSEFLDRFNPYLKLGFRKLLNESIQFSNTKHEHAITETCPGHAAIATGSHPAKSGIVSNSWYDRKKKIVEYCVHDQQFGSSPRNLLTSALPDWIKKQDSKSKVYSVSAKDRSAIMLGGKKANAAFWYNPLSGNFTSSAYYESANTAIVNNAPSALKYFGKSWMPIITDEQQLKAVKVGNIDQGQVADHLPRIIGNIGTSATEKFFMQFYHTPFLDEITGEFAELLLEQKQLGKSEQLDYLAVSFSALDTVGHLYGPNSPEVFDSLLRLDQTLMHLLEAVDRQVGLENTLISLSSDHGIIALPEYDPSKARVTHEQALCEQQIFQKVQEQFGPTQNFIYDLYLTQLSSKELKQFVVTELEKCTHIEKVWIPEDFKNSEDLFAKLYKHSFNRRRSPSFLKQIKENILPLPIRGTEHGSPYDYDRAVPWLIRIPEDNAGATQVTEKIINAAAQTIDIAPTMAGLLGVNIPKHVQGRAMLRR